ncbi:MAG TPA: glucoamylase family protein [Gammaproteobacteria bacterium]|nr:glucoamylase family protein [Gammaproteobacteria bacterium]
MDTETLIGTIQEWLHLKNKTSTEDATEPPLLPELFSADQLERYGITLALSHQLTEKFVPDILLNRLSESEAALIKSCSILTQKITENGNGSLSPASEWLLDNFYLIQEQIHTIRRHLPKGYGRALPHLASGLQGLPRVYDIALQIIEHGDGRWDLENLTRFISAYQSVTPLTLGELWAVPITLGVALIENLSRAAKRIVADKNDRSLADRWADRMIEVAASEPKRLVIVIADMARSDPPMSSAFVAELARRLQGAALSLPLSWIEQHLTDEGLTIEQLVHEENKYQAANQVTVSNSIASLRRLGEVNWRDFVEHVSVVNQTLMTDPAQIYSQMDFSTRDRYRHVIERLSRSSSHPEEEVAAAAILLAKTQAQAVSVAEMADPHQERLCHVGYYLIDAGLPQLKNVLNIRYSGWQKIRHFIHGHALQSYLGFIFLITAALVCGVVAKASQNHIGSGWLWILGITVAICGSQLSVALVNWVATLLVKPLPLPRMDFTHGIPEAFRTLVVVPSMLSSPSSIETLVEALEVRFLGNRDEQLYFALLTDFNDAPQEHMPGDEELLSLAQSQIAELNKRYSREGSDIFFLFHRPRTFNVREKVWMGRERKRGKLTDLNDLLRGNPRENFSYISGDIAPLLSVKYVITLDSDTQLPRESAWQFVGAMAHPLNRPYYDAAKQRVTSGYGILQPRVAEALSNSGQTLYVKLCGGEFGIDPYTRTVSDVYQDVFHEGSFVGKGIYDVDFFQQGLAGRLPDNQILSHDLLEGCYLRSGFLSDTPVYEKSPSSYLADTKRRIRWIRGDWQIIGWLFPKVRNEAGERIANPLSGLSKWKIFDNLRRSLVAVTLLILIALNWTLLPSTVFWLSLTLTIILLPAVVTTLLELVRKPADMLPMQHVTNILHVIQRRAGQLFLYLACLPHEAWYSLSAVFRTCWRNFISRHHLLEWTPSDQVDKRLRGTALEWLMHMWMGPVFASAAVAILIAHKRFESLILALPLLALWFFSPWIALWLSRPFVRKEPKLDAGQIRFLHRMARKTWGFFDTFITAENFWLPPDNYQEAPVPALARRTSPTNIGLSLLASLSAYDFGYINMRQLLERTQNTLQTVSKLEHYRGHLYNWYSTETLEPLLPRYISTVDSGNLAGHLLTLRQGLLALPDEPLLRVRYLDGLEDTRDVLATTVIKSLAQAVQHFQQLLLDARHAFSGWSTALSSCEELCVAAEKIAELSAPSGAALNEMSDWSQKLLLQCQALRDEISLFAYVPGLPANASLRDIALLPAMDNEAQKVAIFTAKERIALIETLAEGAFSFAEMDMSFLYDQASHLMTIGFNVDEQRVDASYYDLLSSEARLGNFVAIAQGQTPQESWFALGRLLVSSGGEPILISWSGSMFEYLMPLLVMPTYPDTLLDQTCRVAVRRQIAYGKQRGLPWGVSESGFNAVDTQINYLYRAFGVPGLGLKRGLEEDLVIAPYASVMALMVAPEAACQNLQRLAAEDVVGKFGFYEAIDFTLSRLPLDSKRAIVRSFMAHHQGMSLLAFSYLLHNQPMQQRFIADPLFQATLLLLQERIPKPTASYLHIPKLPTGAAVLSRPEASMRVFNTPNTQTPQVQLLSNGRYHLVLTQAGGGYSRWKDIAVTRWREDSTCDNWGLFSYVRDVATGEYCSTSYQPTAGSAENFKAVFSEAHADFTRSLMNLDMHTEIVVSPEDDIELRRIRIHNLAGVKRTIEFTSFAEIVLAPQAADQAQAAFSNLFVETELLPEQQAILATRRPRDEQEKPPFMCHRLNVYTEQPFVLSFETDRSQFIGRDRTLAAPLAMLETGDLSNTQGAVLDPIVAIRCRLTLEPDALVTFDLITGVADTHDHCLALAEKYHDRSFANRVFELAWTHGQVLLHQLNITEADAQLFGKLASAIIYTSTNRRADPAIIASNRRGQSGLWGYSISGDLPIVLLEIEDAVNIELVRQLIQAQAYWRRKGLAVDLVILNEERVSYRQTLQDQIMSLINANISANAPDHSGSIVVRMMDQVPLEDHVLLQSVARYILSDKRGKLREQLSRRRVSPPLMPALAVIKSPHVFVYDKSLPLPPDLQFFNGLGGFSASGDEYVIRLSENAPTPAPWVNVLANPNFGTLVSETAQGYTWIENAHEFRLTPWDNDPLKDSSGEAFYVRDEETGQVWSPAALPCPGRGDYLTRHGFGYSVFEHAEEEIHSELSMFVALDAAVKFSVLKIRNDSKRVRRLSVTGYVAWVLGDLRTKNAMYVVTELSAGGALLAQNHYNTEFGERTAFFDAATATSGLNTRTVTGDRAEFIGRNRSLARPVALERKRLSGRVGAALDPCGAIQLTFDLAEGQSREIVFTLGAGQNKSEAESLAQRYRGLPAAQSALAGVRQYWQHSLSALQVTTPDVGFNFLANGWLLYQVLSSRLWGRSGYYQSGGAFGFRDQLQDVMALTHMAPELLRKHLLLCAAHQFEEGDVQHWWHPPSNRGVRTRCSDDYLWLPFVLCHYIDATGDMAVLDEAVPFLRGRPLNVDEESYYDLPLIGTESFCLYHHAVRAIGYGLKFGVHGLPLMGSGDWNDGMNLVGKDGHGESVWLGFFLYSVLKSFAPIAARYGDSAFATRCESESQQLAQHIEAAWDGEWFRRAYFDDGTPLGSASNTECRIDSIAQSWAVLSGAADSLRGKQALAALYHYLVDAENSLIKLLDPPFDESKPSPGYIEGYVPGIRENGGQYTHAAVWAAMAFAEAGDKERAWQLLHMLNPVNHGRTSAEISRYKIEPYVTAGDVYSVAPHTGRGGWSWYTGSAGWMYRLMTETLLGLQLEDGNQLHVKPLLPDAWDGFTADYRYGNTLYKISVKRVQGQEQGELLLDGMLLPDLVLTLLDDGREHFVDLKVPLL